MSYASLFYHIVFSTRQRRPFLSDALMPRLIEYAGGIAHNLQGQILAAGGAADHLHVAAAVHPTAAVSAFIGQMKAGSSGWVHKTFPDMGTFGWQDGYAAFSVSPSVMPKVKAYIRRQREHHRKVSFEEELIALLEKHGIEYDERYIRA
jgi:REP element-mobilizing transposase RayT